MLDDIPVYMYVHPINFSAYFTSAINAACPFFIPGYYCPAGQVTPTPDNYTCPEGHFCGYGFAVPEPCPSGTYQDTAGKWFCKTCPEGFYCNATFGPVVWYQQTICPEGYYCPNGTEYAEQYPCPRGTFNNRTGK